MPITNRISTYRGGYRYRMLGWITVNTIRRCICSNLVIRSICRRIHIFCNVYLGCRTGIWKAYRRVISTSRRHNFMITGCTCGNRIGVTEFTVFDRRICFVYVETSGDISRISCRFLGFVFGGGDFCRRGIFGTVKCATII